MSYFGVRSYVQTFFPKVQSLPLPCKDGSEKSLKELVENNVPEIKNGAYDLLSPMYFNGDLQTMHAAAGNFEGVNKVYYGRRIISFEEENGTAIVSADYLIDPPKSQEEWKESLKYSPLEKPPPYPVRTRYLTDAEIEATKKPYGPDDKPLLILLHGLSGGSHESYVRAVVDDISFGKATTTPEENAKGAFDCVVLNSRGCARTPITTPQLFCGVWTDDIRRFVRIIHTEQPGRRIYLVGFSLGASILANYLGQQGEDALKPGSLDEIAGACIVANPWDLNASSIYLHSTVMGKNLYSPAMTKNLGRLLKNHVKVLEKNPVFDYSKMKTIKYMYEFDDAYTAPFFGFDSASDYYRNGSSILRAINIRTPTLILNALDDPIVGSAALPYKEVEKNPYLVMAATSLGGHLGWYKTGNKVWYPPVISKFFRTLDKNVDYKKGVPKVEVERPHRLFKEDRLVMNN